VPAALAVYVAVLCLSPLLRLLWEAVGPGAAAGVWKVISIPATGRAAWRTLEAGLGATAISVVLGTALALTVALTEIKGRSLLVFLILMPMLVPAQIAAMAWLELTGPSSTVLRPLGLAPPPGTRNWLFSREGIMLLMGIEHSPIVFLSVRAGLRAVGAELIEAARAGGAGPWSVLRRIVLPLAAPSIAAGAALAFVAAVGNFGVPAILGIPARYTMLTALIYQRLSGFGPAVLGEVAVLSLVLAGIAAGGLAVQAIAGRKARAIASGDGRPLVPFRLGSVGAWIATGAVGAVLVPTAVLPVCALIGTSLVTALGVDLTWETVTLKHYASVLDNAALRRAFVNSAYLSLSAAAITLLVAVPFAYHLRVTRLRSVRILNLVVDAPYALPGLVLSIAFILAFLRPLPLIGVSIYGTATIILLAYLARFLALGLRPTVAGMESLDPALEEAARIAGAGPLRRLWSVVLPIAAPAAAAGAMLIVMSAFNELTVSAILWSTGNETVGVMVYNLYDEGSATSSSAASVLSIAVTLAAAGLATLAARRLPGGVLPWRT